MKNHRPLLRRTSLLTLVLVATFVALAGVFACPAQAQASECYVKDASGNVTYYDRFEDGKKAAYGKDKVLVMTSDLSTETTIGIDGGQELTIDMNGYAVHLDKATTVSVFHLYPNSNVTFTSSRREVTIKSWAKVPGGTHIDTEQRTFTTGGVITTGYYTSAIQGGAVYMEEGSHLTLDGVFIAGNYVHSTSSNKGKGGGVYAEKNCTIDLKNKASICYNRASHYGGGIYIDGENCSVTLDNASISNNGAYLGGAIYSGASGTTVTLKNNASIDGNEAEGGGGVYFDQSKFKITSPDKTGLISNNTAYMSSTTSTKGAQSGGGIHVDQKSGENEGLIENLTISGNYSAYDGGAIELDQRWTTIRNCTITGNTSGCEGGAIYVCNDKNIIDNCTIMNNACDLEGKGYEGGGVFVWHDYDIRLSNVCVIKGNTRGKGSTNYDDVMLRENGGATAKAYITGNLKEGSAVGVRTGTSGDRRVAKNFSYANKSCLFADLDGYYVSFGTDEGGDAWQRHSTIEYTSTVNGGSASRHKANSTVTLTAPAAAGKTFWRWGADGSTGLLPVDYYINKSTMYNPTLTFKMPQNDVNVTAAYADTVEKAEISGFKAPTAGEKLPTSATLTRADGKTDGAGDPVKVNILWYKERSDGSRFIVSGWAKAGDTYYAAFVAEQSIEDGRFFSTSMTAADVTLRPDSADGEQGIAPASASVDAATGMLTVKSNGFSVQKTEKPSTSTNTKTASAEILRQWEDAVKKAKEKYQSKDDEKSGDESEAQALALGDDAETPGRGQIDSVRFEYTYDADDEDDGTVTVTAPAAEGYSFSYWEGVPDGWEPDDAAGTVTAAADELDEFTESGGKLKAVYTPAVTKLEVALDAPAAGAALAETCGEIKATSHNADDSVTLSKDGGFKVTWSPEAETAAHGTTYTALVELCDSEGFEDAEELLAQNAAVTCNGTAATSAGFVVTEGKLCLALAFPATGNDAAASVAAPGDVELTFEEAAGYAAEQANYSDEVCWPLPRTLAVTLASGQVVDGDVVWDIPAGFDAGATAAQELRVKGYVCNIATGEDADVDADEELLEVEVTVKVAAPEKESDDAGEKDDQKGDQEADKNTGTDGDEQKTAGEGSEAATPTTQTVTTTTKAAKKGTPSTGDATAPVVGLLATAIACLGAARLSHRRL